MECAYSPPGLRPPPNFRYVAAMSVFAVTLCCVLYYLYEINNPASGPIDLTFSAKFITVKSHYSAWESLREAEALSSQRKSDLTSEAEGVDDSVSMWDYQENYGRVDTFLKNDYLSNDYAEQYDQANVPKNRLTIPNEVKQDMKNLDVAQTKDDFGHISSDFASSKKISGEFGSTEIGDGSSGRDDLTGKVRTSSHDGHRKAPPPLSADFINAINVRYRPQWKAGRNFPATSSWRSIKALVATFLDFYDNISNEQISTLTWKNIHDFRSPRHSQRLTTSSSGGNGAISSSEEEIIARRRALVAKELPEDFDAREAWPGCPSTGQLRNQGGCGSDWAEAPAAVISDRLCIHRDENFRVSGYDLLTCCSSCGLGCSGGTVEKAFLYYMNIGLVSGGPFGSNSGCKPDLIGPSTFIFHSVRTPNCSLACSADSEVGNSTEYWWAKQTGYKTYRIVDHLLVRWDLVHNGPLVAVMDVYEDFFQYRTGVYQRVLGRYVGHHAVKVVGYGVDQDVSYYLCANSWGSEWGDKGFFKISSDGLYNFIVGY